MNHIPTIIERREMAHNGEVTASKADIPSKRRVRIVDFISRPARASPRDFRGDKPGKREKSFHLILGRHSRTQMDPEGTGRRRIHSRRSSWARNSTALVIQTEETRLFNPFGDAEPSGTTPRVPLERDPFLEIGMRSVDAVQKPIYSAPIEMASPSQVEIVDPSKHFIPVDLGTVIGLQQDMKTDI
ncbi:uncharacterized protein ARMOST_03505 [Armillaria ostoyae]|uniref:Uncharacterized protein n=2 Tax=Armillaria TaxID=47424 RepID=A0A284QUU1_ARMOS|nr:hypothetical protein ARMSODRAFT_1077563 [Armillaria solidipes]SJL00193.1 uncharacterized protein ARMOST_03505 [Armillaria ostoyae]